MSGAWRRVLTVVPLAVILGGAAGAAALALLSPPAVPESLRSDQSLTTIRPATAEFDDPHTVTLNLTVDTASGLRSGAGGVLTASSCTPGGTISSGASVASVDGRPIVALALSTPPWRDISVADTGPDVAALENELVRLGAPATANGRWNAADVRAFDSRFKSVGVMTSDDGTVPLALLAWLPAPEVAVASCPAAVGSAVAPGQIVAQFAARLVQASFSPPAGAVPGDRAVALGNGRAPLAPGGTITDPTALALIATSPEFAAVDLSKSPSLDASVVLATPIPATVVPPSSLFGVRGPEGQGAEACVLHDGDAVAVSILASQLGRTVIAPSRPLGEIAVQPRVDLPCP